MKNDKDSGNKKEKRINKIKGQLARLRAKLDTPPTPPTPPTPKEIKTKTKEIKNKKTKVTDPISKAKEAKKEVKIKDDIKKKAKKKVKIKADVKSKAKEAKKEVKIKIDTKKKTKKAKKMEAKIKVEAKKKAKKAKKMEAKIKVEAKKKAKEAKKKEAKIKVEAKKKAKEEAKKKEEEAKKKEEEAKKKEEEAKRTYEEELEEQLSEEEITSFQLEKTDMDKMCNRVCEIIAGYENNGTLQSELWKKLKLSSRDGSRLALKLERMGMITREKILEKERWTYKLIIKKIPINTKSIEGSPCLTCPVEAKCSLDGEISPKTCKLIEDWVLVELKNK